MLRLYSALLAFVVITMPATFRAQQAALTPAQQYDQLATSTRLIRKGAQPFHLKIDTQLYDIKGQPTETGTIEEWWASPTEYRVEINSGSVHEVTATGGLHPNNQATRASYLLNQLLDETETPLPRSSPVDTATVENRHFGKTELECFLIHGPASIAPANSTACVDPRTQDLRIKNAGAETVVRNSVGVFHGANVALATKIAYGGHDAISGKVTALQTLAPGTPGTPTLQPDPPGVDKSSHAQASIAGGVIAGHILRKTDPVYPVAARMNHMGGIVLLHALITKEGRIGDLIVLSSPDDSLSTAATDAVREWVYQPYLLNGEPVEVDTTITVNFNLSQ